MFRFPAARAACVCLAIAFFTSAASAQIKIGVVNIQKALADTDEIKKSSDEQQKKYKPRMDELEKLQKDMETLDTQLNSGKLTPQVQQELQAQGTRKQRDSQRMQDDLQADMDKDRQEILAKMSQKMQAVITKLAGDKGLDLIVEAGQTLFTKPDLDLTAAVTAAYNQANPAK